MTTDANKPVRLRRKATLPSYSIGWYSIARVDELPDGKPLARTFAGQDVVIFRTDSGKVSVLDAHCKHMGAHFAHGGRVEGENIVCPFHGFCFDGSGKCTKTGYDSAPPPKLQVGSWPVKVTGGLVFCWYHPDRATPDWQIDSLEDEDYTHFKIHEWKLRSNVVEIAENSVDIGHFYHVHKYQDPYLFEDLTTDGPILRAGYGMKRLGSFGRVSEIDAQFRIKQQGLGIAVVNTEVPVLGVKTRHLVMASPIDEEHITLRIGAALRVIESKAKVHPLAVLAPQGLLMKIIHQQLFKNYVHDVAQDLKIWTNKIYVHPPMLAKGDGPIMKYRKWASQFDPRPDTDPRAGRQGDEADQSSSPSARVSA